MRSPGHKTRGLGLGTGQLGYACRVRSTGADGCIWRVPKVRDAIRLIERDGWRLVRTRGSHWHFRHPEKPGIVTVAGRLSKDLALGTWNSILKQADLDRGPRR